MTDNTALHSDLSMMIIGGENESMSDQWINEMRVNGYGKTLVILLPPSLPPHGVRGVLSRDAIEKSFLAR